MNYRSAYQDLKEIRRAREYRLYDAAGRRYLDLYQDAGRAVLGHRPTDMNRSFKSAASKGLWAPFTSKTVIRLEQAVQRLVGPGAIRFFSSMDRALSSYSRERVLDPLFADSWFSSVQPDPERALALLWRPFIPEELDALLGRLLEMGQPVLLLPIMPVPGGFAPQAAVHLGNWRGALVPGDAVSPAAAAFASAALRELAGCRRESLELPAPGADLWHQCGPYLLWKGDEVSYGRCRTALLEKGILLPASRNEPAILPSIYSEGEIAPLFAYREDDDGNL